MKILDSVTNHLQSIVPDAVLEVQQVAGTTIRLWLISPHNMQQKIFDSVEITRILQEPPYWCFCWSSGAALCQKILQNPELVVNKRILDFGAGSGCVGIAASLAGAKEVTVCDLDPVALQACQANAELNGANLSYLADFTMADDHYDLIVAADILYDRDNFSWLDVFPNKANHVLLADSRVKNFQHKHYQLLATMESETLPDLLEPTEFRNVKLYQTVY